MINILIKNNKLVIFPKTISSKNSLSSPIHRIYLRSKLEGVLDKGDNKWHIPFMNGFETLTIVIKHFERYNLTYSLDDNCKNILKGIENSKKEFITLLENGIKAKRKINPNRRKEIVDFISTAFKRKLTDHQLNAVNHLLTVRNGANFSVPGSGKTSIALAYFYYLLKKREISGLLIIGPASCFEPWENEYNECFGKKPESLRISGNPKTKRVDLYLIAEQYDILLNTYHTATRDVNEINNLLKRRNYLLILDESHYIKRPQGGKIANAVLNFANSAKYRLILTGTPMPNSFEDMWSQFTFLWKEQLPLGKIDTYLQEIKDTKPSNMLISLKERIDPLFFRITKSQLGLPTPTFLFQYCDLSPLQSRIYSGVAAKFLIESKESPQDRDTLREWRRARAIRLMQIASNPSLLHRDSKEFHLPPLKMDNLSLKVGIENYSNFEMPCKFKTAMDLANKLCNEGNKVIIWTSFIHNLFMLEKELNHFNPVTIYGGVPYKASYNQEMTREYLIKTFKQDSNCKLLLANPAACAESISLHKVCHISIYLDRTFNCAHYIQSLDRIHRLGLSDDQKTFYYLLLSKNTIDEVIHQRLNEKMDNMRSVIEGELPGIMQGYWGEDQTEEEARDFDIVESHIKNIIHNEN